MDVGLILIGRPFSRRPETRKEIAIAVAGNCESKRTLAEGAFKKLVRNE
jgi:hypothetical protein